MPRVKKKSLRKAVVHGRKRSKTAGKTDLKRKALKQRSVSFVTNIATNMLNVAKGKQPPKDVAAAQLGSNAAVAMQEYAPVNLMKPMLSVVGSQFVSFWYIHYGGRNNLLPGRPEELRFGLSVPDGAQVFTAITKINFGYINGNEDNPPMNLNEHPLGQLGIDVWVDGSDLVCWMRLSTNNQTVPCIGEVNVNVLYFI